MNIVLRKIHTIIKKWIFLLDMTYYQKKSIKSICFIANVLCNLLYKKNYKMTISPPLHIH